MAPKGGKRAGAGRKPSPNRLVNVQSKVSPETKQWLISLAALQKISVSKLIALIIDSQRSQHP